MRLRYTPSLYPLTLLCSNLAQALARDLHVQFQFDYSWNPPSLPPISPHDASPPPPPKPPSPKPPAAEAAIIRRVPIYAATLSTYFVPQMSSSPPPSLASNVDGSLYGRKLQEANAPSEYGLSMANDARDALLAELGSTFTTWAACTQDLVAAGAPLSCRTAGNPIRCVDGARHCGTAYDNTYEPYLELDFHDYQPDYGGRMYLFAVHFRTPPQEEYARLFFHPADAYGGDTQERRGWTLTAFDDHKNELSVQCQAWNEGASATEWVDGLEDVTHRCLPALAEDGDYEEMSKARYLRITMIGEYRQLWVDHVDVYFRAIADINIDGSYKLLGAPTPPPFAVPPPPGSPPAPPDPSPPPATAACVFYPLEAVANWETAVVVREPCGLTQVECCAHAHDYVAHHGTAAVQAYVLSASGCCYLVSQGWSGTKVAFGVGGAGTGVVGRHGAK